MSSRPFFVYGTKKLATDTGPMASSLLVSPETSLAMVILLNGYHGKHSRLKELMNHHEGQRVVITCRRAYDPLANTICESLREMGIAYDLEKVKVMHYSGKGDPVYHENDKIVIPASPSVISWLSAKFISMFGSHLELHIEYGEGDDAQMIHAKGRTVDDIEKMLALAKSAKPKAKRRTRTN